MKNRLLFIELLCSVAVILFAALPNGIVMRFHTPEMTAPYYYSYFSLTPFGFAYFFPLLLVIFTFAIVILIIRNLLSDKPSLALLNCVILWNLFQSVMILIADEFRTITVPSVVITSLFIIMLGLNVIIYKLKP